MAKIYKLNTVNASNPIMDVNKIYGDENRIFRYEYLESGGIMNVIASGGPEEGALLAEDGSFLYQEDNSYILL